MNDASRTQGWAICIGSAALAFFFLIGILNGSYWAIALPVAVLTFFALGLAGWVGYTIATIQVEPDPAPEFLSTDTPSQQSTPVHTPAATSAPADSQSAGDNA